MSYYSRSTRKYNDIDPSIKHALDDFINREDNKGKCCECLSPSIKFVSLTFKCVLCSRCGNAHMDNMPKSIVKSTVYKDSWTQQDLRTLTKSRGNRENYKVYNGKHQPFPYDGDTDKIEVNNYITDKYVYGKYMDRVDDRLLYDSICDGNNNEYNDSPPREQRQYVRNTYEHKPQLPTKPRPNTKAFNPAAAVFTGEDPQGFMSEPQFSNPKPAVFDGSEDYQQSYGNAQMYTQEYPMQNAYQQMPQANNQNQQIMSMYSQPGVYQSGVEIGPGHPQYQEILNQQQQIQQQQMYQQQMYQQQMYQQQLQQQQQNQFNNNNGFY